MRGRVGGNLSVANQDLELLDAGSRDYWGESHFVGRGGRVTTARHPSFRGHSVMLIDESTRSAGEVMAYGYQNSGFGPVIGTRTAGAVAGGQTFVMPGELVLYLAVSALYFGERSLEGTGVTPERRIERPLPYAAGADPVLDAALELAAK
jgi:carboxyl-terminal processing protease